MYDNIKYNYNFYKNKLNEFSEKRPTKVTMNNAFYNYYKLLFTVKKEEDEIIEKINKLSISKNKDLENMKKNLKKVLIINIIKIIMIYIYIIFYVI
jgi:hypothetical protein